MGNLKLTELNAFNGGMNNVSAPYLIHPTESTFLVNVDLTRGAMQSSSQPKHSRDASKPYFYQYNIDVYEYDLWRSNVLWDNKWYWSDGKDTGKVLPDGTEKTLGIKAPTLAPDVVVATEDDGTTPKKGPHLGDFKYCYTFYDSNTGVESAPSPLSLYIEGQENTFKIAMPEGLPTDATHYRIYRIGGYLPYFMLVEKTELSEFEDNLDDTQIDGRELDTIRNGLPPQGIHYFVEMNGRLYGAKDNRLYFSALGNPDSWYIYDFIPCQGSIRGLAKAPGGLIVFGHGWTALLAGRSPLDFRLQVLSDDIGIVDASSIAYMDNSVIWLSPHGLCMTDGYSIKQITSEKIENVEGLNPIGACVLNNVYYMGFKPQLYPRDDLYPSDDLYPNAVKGTGGIDQGIIELDFKRGQGYAYKILDIPELNYVDMLDGKVAINTGDFSTPLFDSCDDIAFEECLGWLPCSGAEISYLNVYSLDRLEAMKYWETLDYLSPLLVDNSTTTLKEYDKVRIVFKGVFRVQVLFDNDRVLVDRMIESVTEEAYDYDMIGIPNEDNKAYSIRFRITGRGIVKGIQYSWKPRETV